MEMLFKLYSRQGSYKDPQTGEVRTSTHYYLAPQNVEIDPLHPDWKKLVGFKVDFFPDPATGKDPRYASRKQLVDMFAIPLAPAKPADGVQTQEAPVSASSADSSGVSSGVVTGIPDFLG